MKVLTAKVVNGRVDVPEGLLEEGATVTVLVEDRDGVVLSEDQERELSMAIAEADRGEGVDGWQLLESVRSS